MGTKIPDLNLADVLAGDDELVVEQGGATKRVLAGELSRHVMTTAAGGNGAEDGANTWCKICDISLNTGTDADLPISLKFLASQQANGGSMDAEVFIRQTGGVGIAGTSYINVTAIHCADTFSPDSLKLISNAEGSAQLWLRKDSNFNTIYVYEIGKGGFNEAATPISYNNNAAWQSATPSGAVNITGTYIDSVNGTATINFSSDADLSPTSAQLVNQFLIITDTGTVLTTGRNVILSDDTRTWAITNSTTQPLTFKTSGGTGITVDAGKSAILRGDGTHIDYHLTGFMGDLEGGSLSGSSITGLTSLSVAANSSGNVARYVMETATATAAQYATLATIDLGSTNNSGVFIQLLLNSGEGDDICTALINVYATQATTIDSTESKIQVINITDGTNVAYDDFFLTASATTNGTDIILSMQSKTAVKWHVTEIMRRIGDNVDATTPIMYNDGATWSATDPTSGAAVSVTSDWAGNNWVAPTLLNSWVNYGGTFYGAAYSKSADGLVMLRGLIKNGTTTAGTVIFTLPTGYRPASDYNFPISTNGGGDLNITIRAGGNVAFGASGGDATFSNLSGISFYAEQ